MVGKFLVIGLGRFGSNVAINLARSERAVLAVDRSPKLVQELATIVDSAVCLDSTDAAALRELGIEDVACAVVAIGSESIESSILTTSVLRQMGVPRLIARAVTELHGRVLYAVGAHEVVNPEQAMGRRLARQLANPGLLEHLELGDGAEMAEVEVPEAWVGKTLVELDVRRNYAVSVVAIRRANRVLATLSGDERLESNDVLITVGPPRTVARLANLA
jgi:trk system potassium uptake protein TrkA